MNDRNIMMGAVEVVDGEEKPEFTLCRDTPHQITVRWPMGVLPIGQYYPQVDMLLLGLRQKFEQSRALAQCSIIDGIRGLFVLTAIDVDRLTAMALEAQARADRLEERIAKLEKRLAQIESRTGLIG